MYLARLSIWFFHFFFMSTLILEFFYRSWRKKNFVGPRPHPVTLTALRPGGVVKKLFFVFRGAFRRIWPFCHPGLFLALFRHFSTVMRPPPQNGHFFHSKNSDFWGGGGISRGGGGISKDWQKSIGPGVILAKMHTKTNKSPKWLLRCLKWRIIGKSLWIDAKWFGSGQRSNLSWYKKNRKKIKKIFRQ